MSHKIIIKSGSLELAGELNETVTAKNIGETLPIEGRANRWGDEIYFSIQVEGSESDVSRTEMQVGEMAFWPPGNAFCIFWGPTPASQAGEPRAASPVVPVGKIIGDCQALQQVADGQTLRIETAES